ncbi:nuclear envelope integral membrane protein 1-like [Acanthaster planci]|uniref:Nuclear envelope integral membrane protein 1-like n=1 Tax=Acanthaster planci TaxID=133434 RepID=A0A8B7XNB2_ACAPL|nr:nuclear envelope integral membrane protein 1-like [Acanthaster planci]XP_022081668.1 nuclear envelope integral membrane protein 1-like [Acanthaster planci]
MAGKAVHLSVVIACLVFLFSAVICSATGVVLPANIKVLESCQTDNYNRCFEARVDWRWLRLWSTLNVKVVNVGPPDTKITVVVGANMTDVEKHLSKKNGILPSLLPPWVWSQPRGMSPLHNNCIGVRASDQVEVTVTETYVHWMYFLLTVGGVSLVFAAPRLSKSVVFHYSTGVTLGTVASLLILVYILSRFIPRRTGALSLLLGGWAVCFYFVHWVLDNFLALQYKPYLIGYVVLAAFISFAVCYWYGPVTSDRTIYLIQLCIQLLGLVSIYNGSQHEASTVAIIAVLAVIWWLPRGRMKRAGSILRWWSNQQVRIRLLTEDEYYEQGRVETRKALDELREFCRSPECNQWQMIAKLESPKRFAQFVLGDEDHVSRAESSAYEDDLSLLTLDSSDDGSGRMTSDSDMETE